MNICFYHHLNTPAFLFTLVTITRRTILSSEKARPFQGFISPAALEISSRRITAQILYLHLLLIGLRIVSDPALWYEERRLNNIRRHKMLVSSIFHELSSSSLDSPPDSHYDNERDNEQSDN